MSLRYVCPIEDYPDDFIEVSEAWTRGEYRTFWQSEDGAAVLAVWAAKLVACHLSRPQGEALTDPKTISEETIDSLDMRVFLWVQGAMLQAATEVSRLGKDAQRALWPTSDATPAPNGQMTPTPTP